MPNIKEKQISELNSLYEKSSSGNIKGIITDIIDMAEKSKSLIAEIKSSSNVGQIEQQRDYAMYDHLLSEDISIEANNAESLLKAALKESKDLVGILSVLKSNYGPELSRRLEALEYNEILNKNRISNLLDTFIYESW